MVSPTQIDIRERDRVRKAARRRSLGMVPQSSRHIRANDEALASMAGVSDRYIRKLRTSGRLETWLVKAGIVFPELSANDDACGGTLLGTNDRLFPDTSLALKAKIAALEARKADAVAEWIAEDAFFRGIDAELAHETY